MSPLKSSNDRPRLLPFIVPLRTGEALYESVLGDVEHRCIPRKAAISHNAMAQKALQSMLQHVADKKFRDPNTHQFNQNCLTVENAEGEIKVLALKLSESGEFIWATKPNDSLQSYAEQVSFFKDIVAQVSKETGISKFHLYEYLLVGAFKEFGDPYTRYIIEEEREREKANAAGEFVGVGVETKLEKGITFLLGVFEGSSAQQAGLQKGDVITHIDGHSIENMPDSEIDRLFLGAVGTEVVFTLKRGSDVFNKTVTRGLVQMDPTQGSVLIDGDTAYLKLSSFTETSFSFVQKKLMDLRAQAGRDINIALDLRGNLGGRVDQADLIWDFLLEDKVGPKDIAYIAGKTVDGNPVHMDSSIDGKFPYKNLVVLVDSRSSSSAELVAGIAQDFGVKVFGMDRSYGKGVFQDVFQQRYLVTSGYLFTGPRKRTHHVDGVMPSDKIVCRDFRDAQFAAAKHQTWGDFKPLPMSQTRGGDTPGMLHMLNFEYAGILTERQIAALPSYLVRDQLYEKRGCVVPVFDATMAAALVEFHPEKYSQYLTKTPHEEGAELRQILGL